MSYWKQQESKDRKGSGPQPPIPRRSSTGTGRESFGRARSTPHRISAQQRSSGELAQIYPAPERKKSGNGRKKPEEEVTATTSVFFTPGRTQSKPQLNLSLKKSKSIASIDGGGAEENQNQRRSWRTSASKGQEKEEEFVTRHMLYKEAMYTGAHFLGKESDRFPCNKERICMYVHEAFSSSSKEQSAVIDHVKGELFPVIGVNTKIIKGEGLRSQGEGPIKAPNSYCVVAIENEGSELLFSSGKPKELHQTVESPFNKFTRIVRRSIQVQPPAERRVQFYAAVPPAHRTPIKPYERDPVWEQAFQSVSVHPSSDALTVEVWDRVEDDSLRKSIAAYNSAHKITGSLTPSGPQPPASFPRRLSKEDAKRADVCLGRLSKKVAEISCEGFEKTVHLEPLSSTDTSHGKLKLRIWLVHLYRHGKPYVEMVDKRTMLACLWDWILSFEKGRDKEWEGRLPPEANCLLYQYALQTGISEETHCHIRWNAYAKHKLDMEGLEIPLKDIDDALRKRKSSTVAPAARSPLEESQLGIENSILALMEEDIFPIIRGHLSLPEERVGKALKAYKSCADVLSKFEVSYALTIFLGLFEKALRLAFLEWYQGIFATKVSSGRATDRCTLVKFHVELMSDVNKLLSLGAKKWGPSFWMLAEFEAYLAIGYDELQKMVNHDIEAVCWNVMKIYENNKVMRDLLRKGDKEEECVVSALFSLYAGTQTFVDGQREIFDGGGNGAPSYTNLNNFHKWFRPVLPLWLGFALIRGSEMITRCVNIDSVSVDNVHALTSTSALDTASVLHQLVHFWQKLSWPDVAERYVLIHFLIEVCAYFSILYAKRKAQKLELEGYFDTEDRFDISERLCTALNNIEYVKETLEGVPDEINYEGLILELESVTEVSRESVAYRQRLKHVFTVSFANVDAIFHSILLGLGKRVRPEINRCAKDCVEILLRLRHLDTRSLHDALDPLLSYLDSNISTLAKSLLSLNFARLLQLFWNLSLQELMREVNAIRCPDGDEHAELYRRVKMIIPELRQFFDNGDAGLTEDELGTPEYWQFHELLTLHNMTTDEVIEHFYGARAAQQMELDRTPAPSPKDPNYFGILTVRVGYWVGKLSVEVISAHDLVDLDSAFDPWALCRKKTTTNDPFVQIDLKPEVRFNNNRSSKTHVEKKTLEPVWNEKFQWDVTQGEMTTENGAILFTVKDFDYIVDSDFLGEAVVPLSVIPGISSKPVPQPMHLRLRSVPLQSPILSVLKTRHWDSNARRFIERQKVRHVNKV